MGMSEPQGILLFGANGSGKTTLGRKLAQVLGWKHMDAEDYFFEPSDIPYSNPRTRDEVSRLMLADIEKHRNFVLTSVTGDYGDEITRWYRLAVYLSAPHDLRMERVKRRSYDKLGDRIREGGDMYGEEQRFFDFVATRPLSKIDDYAETLSCPVIRVDGTIDWHSNAKNIAEQYRSLTNKGGNP
jgi:cytidylate kinase